MVFLIFIRLAVRILIVSVLAFTIRFNIISLWVCELVFKTDFQHSGILVGEPISNDLTIYP